MASPPPAVVDPSSVVAVPLSAALTARVLGPQSSALLGTSMVRNSASAEGERECRRLSWKLLPWGPVVWSGPGNKQAGWGGQYNGGLHKR